MSTERRLGRGLGSLLGGGPASDSPATLEPSETSETRSLEIEVELISPNPFQPRETFDPAALEELRDSIRQHGILQPLVLRPIEGGFELVAGERRLRAARLAGLAKVPVVLRPDLTDGQMLELALVENVQRRDLDAMERARGYQRMMDALELTQAQVAEKVGLRRSTIANHLRLLELPSKAQDAVAQGLISMGHARAMLSLQDPEAVLELVERTAREGLSVRKVEELARQGGLRPVSVPRSPSSSSSAQELPPWARELEDRMREHLGTRVQLRLNGAEKGQVVVDFFSRASLDRVVEVLAPRREL